MDDSIDSVILSAIPAQIARQRQRMIGHKFFRGSDDHGVHGNCISAAILPDENTAYKK